MEVWQEKTIELIARVVEGESLIADDAEKVFSSVFRNDTKGYLFTALVSALHAKGETSDELLGLCNSTKRLGVKIRPRVSPENITDLAGTGGSKIKTINVSTAASFIVAAAGVVVAKQAGFAQTSPTGSGDVFRAFGIDTYKLSKRVIEACLETVGVCPLYVPAMSPKLKNRSEVARKVYVENGLRTGSPFHIAAFAYSPTKLKRRIYGCYSEKYLEVLGELFMKLGNERTLIMYGVGPNGGGGIAEASVIGKTIIVDQQGRNIKKYLVGPGDFGLKKAGIEEIRTGGKERNIVDFLRILYGEETGAKADMVLANSSASLYVMGKVESFEEGTEEARRLVTEGAAAKKLEVLVDRLGDRVALEKWKKKAGVGGHNC